MVGSIHNRIAAFEHLAATSKTQNGVMPIVPNPTTGFSAVKANEMSVKGRETYGVVAAGVSNPPSGSFSLNHTHTVADLIQGINNAQQQVSDVSDQKPESRNNNETNQNLAECPGGGSHIEGDKSFDKQRHADSNSWIKVDESRAQPEDDSEQGLQIKTEETENESKRIPNPVNTFDDLTSSAQGVVQSVPQNELHVVSDDKLLSPGGMKQIPAVNKDTPDAISPELVGLKGGDNNTGMAREAQQSGQTIESENLVKEGIDVGKNDSIQNFLHTESPFVTVNEDSQIENKDNKPLMSNNDSITANKGQANEKQQVEGVHCQQNDNDQVLIDTQNEAQLNDFENIWGEHTLQEAAQVENDFLQLIERQSQQNTNDNDEEQRNDYNLSSSGNHGVAFVPSETEPFNNNTDENDQPMKSFLKILEEEDKNLDLDEGPVTSITVSSKDMSSEKDGSRNGENEVDRDELSISPLSFLGHKIDGRQELQFSPGFGAIDENEEMDQATPDAANLSPMMDAGAGKRPVMKSIDDANDLFSHFDIVNNVDESPEIESKPVQGVENHNKGNLSELENQTLTNKDENQPERKEKGERKSDDPDGDDKSLDDYFSNLPSDGVPAPSILDNSKIGDSTSSANDHGDLKASETFSDNKILTNDINLNQSDDDSLGSILGGETPGKAEDNSNSKQESPAGATPSADILESKFDDLWSEHESLKSTTSPEGNVSGPLDPEIPAPIATEATSEAVSETKESKMLMSADLVESTISLLPTEWLGENAETDLEKREGNISNNQQDVVSTEQGQNEEIINFSLPEQLQNGPENDSTEKIMTSLFGFEEEDPEIMRNMEQKLRNESQSADKTDETLKEAGRNINNASPYSMYGSIHSEDDSRATPTVPFGSDLEKEEEGQKLSPSRIIDKMGSDELSDTTPFAAIDDEDLKGLEEDQFVNNSRGGTLPNYEMNTENVAHALYNEYQQHGLKPVPSHQSKVQHSENFQINSLGNAVSEGDNLGSKFGAETANTHEELQHKPYQEMQVQHSGQYSNSLPQNNFQQYEHSQTSPMQNNISQNNANHTSNVPTQVNHAGVGHHSAPGQNYHPLPTNKHSQIPHGNGQLPPRMEDTFHQEMPVDYSPPRQSHYSSSGPPPTFKNAIFAQHDDNVSLGVSVLTEDTYGTSAMTYSVSERSHTSSTSISQGGQKPKKRPTSNSQNPSKPTPIFRTASALRDNPMLHNAHSTVSDLTGLDSSSVASAGRRPSVHAKNNIQHLATINSATFEKPETRGRSRGVSPFGRRLDKSVDSARTRTSLKQHSIAYSDKTPHIDNRKKEEKKRRGFSWRSLSPFRRRSSKRMENDSPPPDHNIKKKRGKSKKKKKRGKSRGRSSANKTIQRTPSQILEDEERAESSVPLVAVDTSLDSFGRNSRKHSIRSLSPFSRRKAQGRQSRKKNMKPDPFDEDGSI